MRWRINLISCEPSRIKCWGNGERHTVDHRVGCFELPPIPQYNQRICFWNGAAYQMVPTSQSNYQHCEAYSCVLLSGRVQFMSMILDTWIHLKEGNKSSRYHIVTFSERTKCLWDRCRSLYRRAACYFECMTIFTLFSWFLDNSSPDNLWHGLTETKLLPVLFKQ